MNKKQIKISCEQLEQEVSLITMGNDIYIVELTIIKDNLFTKQTGMHISWSYNNYDDAIQKYLLLAAEQAKHIALMSL